MRPYKDHLILTGTTVKDALFRLNELSQDAILFVVDIHNKLLGTLTDGDIRRGLMKDYSIDGIIDNIIQKEFRYIQKGNYEIDKIIEYRKANYRIIPIIDNNGIVVNVLNFRHLKSYLPIDAVVMAGGKGQRLHPLTIKTPKPLIKIGDKPILEYNLDLLSKYGIDNFWISINYLGDQIESYFGSGVEKNIQINYVKEDTPLGTLGSLSLIKDFTHDYILVTNSDLLTNVDLEQFYIDFIKNDADLAVLTIPYQVNIPYAVLETHGNAIKSFKEKPTYTYYSNGGVYLFKRKLLKYLPENIFFNTTDFIQNLIDDNLKVISYPFLGYWLDIGKHDDLEKAQRDIKSFSF